MAKHDLQQEKGHLPRGNARWIRGISTEALNQWRESWKKTPWSREHTAEVNKELLRRDRRRAKRI